ncbi:MAG: hypothetical protein QXY40_00620 [Candidatus Methanomethylicia archaeon]
MVSWSKAFRQAVLILVFTIIWGIIGGIIVLIGAFMTGESSRILLRSIMTEEYPIIEPTTISSIIPSTTFMVGLIVMLIGFLIAILGYTATFIKYLTETIIDEVKPLPTPPQPYIPPPSQATSPEQQT